MGFITKIKGLSDIPTFNVVKEQLFDSRGEIVPKTFSIMREDTRQSFGTCSDKYRTIQLDEMLEIVDKASSNFDMDHIGYTYSGDGKRIVIQSQVSDMGESVDGDHHEGFMYTVIDNTGMSSNKIIPSTIRIACDNALHLVNKEGLRSNLRHSNTYNDRIKSMILGIEHNLTMITDYSNCIRRLKSSSFTSREMEELVLHLLPNRGERDRPSARLTNKRFEIIDLFESGTGNEGKSKFDALNAFTEFETGKRSRQKHTPEKFIRSLNGNTLSNKALLVLD